MSITSSMNSLRSSGYNVLSKIASKVKENPKTTAGIAALSTGLYLTYHNAEAIQALFESFKNSNQPVVKSTFIPLKSNVEQSNVERLESFFREYILEAIGGALSITGKALGSRQLEIMGLGVTTFSIVDRIVN